MILCSTHVVSLNSIYLTCAEDIGSSGWNTLVSHYSMELISLQMLGCSVIANALCTHGALIKTLLGHQPMPVVFFTRHQISSFTKCGPSTMNTSEPEEKGPSAKPYI